MASHPAPFFENNQAYPLDHLEREHDPDFGMNHRLNGAPHHHDQSHEDAGHLAEMLKPSPRFDESE